MENLLRQLIAAAAKGQDVLYNQIFRIKTKATYQQLCELTDNPSSILSRYIHLIIGNPLPVNVEELGTREVIFQTSNFDIELNWFLLALRRHTKEINKFLALKEEFEKFIVLSEYEKAQAVLNGIEKDICVSLWSVEKRLMLAQLTGGLTENRRVFEELNSSENYMDVRFLAHYYSERVDPDVGVASYRNKMLAAFYSYYGDDREVLINYFMFKLDPYEAEMRFDAAGIMEQEARFSIIDRYLTFQKIVILYSGNQLALESKSIDNRIASLLKRIDDPVLQNAIALIRGQMPTSPLNDLEQIALECQDLYLLGKYQECYNRSVAYVKVDPLNFFMLKLVAKVSLFIDKDEFDISSPDLLEKIIKTIRIVYSRGEDGVLTSMLLVKLSYMFESFRFAFSLYNLFAIERYNVFELLQSATCTSRIAGPDFYKAFHGQGKLKILEKQKSRGEGHLCYTYYLNALEGKAPENTILVSDNPMRKRLINVDNLLMNGQYEQCIAELGSLKSESRVNGYMYEKVIRRLYDAFVLSLDYNEAVKLLVEAFFDSPLMIVKLDADTVISNIRKARFNNVAPTIYLPAFYHISKAEETELFNACRLFIENNGVKRASELSLECVDPDQKHLLIYFLDKICTTDSLKHSTRFSTPNEMEIERIDILKKLRLIDPSSEPKYDEQIRVTEKKLIILDGLNKMDEGKIYINETAIFENELQIHLPAYEAFMKLLKVYVDNPQLAAAGEPEEGLTPAYLSQNIQSVIKAIGPNLKELFIAVRNEFLFNKFGLVNYLSTRIRHGIFEAAVRPIFERNFLLTQKDTLGKKYLPNTYWNHELLTRKAEEKLKRIQEILADFSQAVDGLIAQVLSEQLQIRTESKNKNGLFNYTYVDNEIDIRVTLNNQLLSYKEFVFAIFRQLWIRTETNLENIRNFLTQQLLRQFEDLLSGLEEQMLKIIAKDEFENFYLSLSICKSQLAEDLEKVSNWFLRSNTQMSDVHLSDIIDITHEHFNRTRTSKKILLTKGNSIGNKIQGQYYIPFTDLFRIFLENAFKHSQMQDQDVLVNIDMNQVNDLVAITITNSVGERVNIPEVQEHVAAMKLQANTMDKLTSENKSGLLKAINILKSEFANPDNDLNITSSENNDFQVTLQIHLNNLTT